MAKYIIFFLLLPIFVYAESYDDFYEKSGNSGNDGDFYEGSDNKIDIKGFYDDQRNDGAIPDGVDKPGDEKNSGYDLGSSLKGNVSSESGLKDILKNMQNGGDMEPLSKTYVCPVDNVTYGDESQCTKNCVSVCDVFKFRTEISCQNAKEVLRLTPDHIGANPAFSIKYQDRMYHTQKVDAVCGNGYMSGGVAYEWLFTKDGLNFVTPASLRSLGECRDMTGKSFMSEFNSYYEPMIFALQANISKLGFVTTSNINGGDFSLSINIIVAGACDENSLKSDMPNADAIDKMREGRLDISEATNIAKNDPNYEYISSGKDYSAKSCSITNSVSLYSDTKTIREDNRFKGTLPDVTKKNKGSTFVYNNGTLIGISQNGRYEEEFLSKLTGRFISSDLLLGEFLNSNGDIYNGCNNGSSIPQSSSCQIENRWIESSVPYDFVVNVEKTISEDVFSTTETDACDKDNTCKLNSESVCDMFGGNCVELIKNGSSTGMKAPKLCNQIDTSLDTYMVCADGKTISATGSKKMFSSAGGYFVLKRSYSCQSDNGTDYDYSGFVDQNKSITDSMVVSDKGDVSFSATGTDGKPLNFQTNVTLQDAECQMTCKVQKPGVTGAPIINSDGKTITPNTVTQNGVTTILPRTTYKTCSKKGKKWSCELDKDETMVSDCECPDDFADTLIEMQLISESAKNMKCSSK